MEPHLIEKRPTWWLLYVIAGVMVVLVALVETSVPEGRPRMALEITVVVAIFALMLRWIRANRGRIELAESRELRPPAVELVIANGQLPSKEANGSRPARPRPRMGRRRMA